MDSVTLQFVTLWHFWLIINNRVNIPSAHQSQLVGILTTAEMLFFVGTIFLASATSCNQVFATVLDTVFLCQENNLNFFLTIRKPCLKLT